MSAAKRAKLSHPAVVDLTHDDSVIVNDGRDKNLVVITLDDDSDHDTDPEPQIISPPGTKSLYKESLRSRTTNKASARNRRTTPTPAPPPPRPETPPNVPKCPICIETYSDIKKKLNGKIVTTRCGHIFCESCLKRSFLASGRKCPKCRKTLPKGPSAFIEIFDVC